MANIQRTITNRHDWSYRRLPGLPGAHELKKLGQEKWGYLCMNCRKAWDPEDGDPPIGGCPSGTKVMHMGRSCQADHVKHETRALADQAQREHDEEQRLA